MLKIAELKHDKSSKTLNTNIKMVRKSFHLMALKGILTITYGKPLVTCQHLGNL